MTTAVTSHRRQGGRFMPARRWAFPLSALSAALVLLWATSTRQGGLAPERTGVSGTIGRPPGVGATPLLGAGQASVAARWQRTDSGFLLFLESGGLPAEVVCTAATADVRLESEPSGPGVAAGRALHLSVVPGRPAVVRGLSRTPVVVLRLQARFGGGRTETRDLTITGLQDAASGPGEGGRPTSGPPPGH